ncbi:MAG: ketoacyl-ACP synthase III [Bacteroidales bacterium]|nr:ketoacyl-ACP synthase III [Bacteroidales bacterium]
MACKISNIAVYLPENVLTNEEIAAVSENLTAEKIEKKLGIQKRHIAANNETALDLAFNACDSLLKNYDKNSIDFLVLCTQSPDYFLPTSACILQNRLDLPKNIGAFDFNLGCSGFIYGLSIAKGFINSEIANKMLLVMTDTYSKHLHKNDLSNRTIFGDAASACIIEKAENEHIHHFVLGTDGSGANQLIVPNGCLRNPFNPNEKEITDESGNVRTNNNLYMNGPEIFNFTIDTVPNLVEQTLKKNQLNASDIDYYIFHQANKYILEYLRKKIGIAEEKFYNNLLDTGNTVSSTIPIAISNLLQSGKIKEGNKLLLCGFGVGLSWGSVIVDL